MEPDMGEPTFLTESVSSLTGGGRPARWIEVRRLLGATFVAALTSAVANSVLQAVAVDALAIRADFEPLAGAAPALSSIVAAVGAAIVLAVLARFSRRPRQLFYRVSGGFFALSFIPLVVMGLQDPPQYPGTGAQSIGTLAVMHVIALIAIVPVLGRVAGGRQA
jgi:hypothetical protein